MSKENPSLRHLSGHPPDWGRRITEDRLKRLASQSNSSRPARGDDRLGAASKGPICMANVDLEPTRWLVPGWLPIGAIAGIYGDPGAGKGRFMAAAAGALSRGLPIRPGDAPTEPLTVLFVTSEDNAAELRRRLHVAEANMSRVYCWPLVDQTLPSHHEEWRAELYRLTPDVLFVNPYTAVFDDGLDAHKANDAQRVGAVLRGLIEEADCACLVDGHPNKASHAKAAYRWGGSVSIMGTLRVALAFGYHPGDPTRRALRMTKNNLGPLEGHAYLLEAKKGMIGEEEHAVFYVTGRGSFSANGILDASPDAREGGGEARGSMEQRVAAVVRANLENGGSIDERDLERKLLDASLSVEVYRRKVKRALTKPAVLKGCVEWKPTP